MDSEYLFAFLEGILTFISPCLLPIIPIYFLYLGGNVDGDGNKSIKKFKLITNAFGFVLGFTTIFIILGILASVFGKALGNNAVIRIVSGILIIAFGLNFIGVFKIKLLKNEKRFNFNVKNLNLLKSFLFGMVFSFGWSPCTGPFLGAALGLAANKNSIGEGVLLLFTYSLGLAIPFMLSAIIFEQLKNTLKSIQKHSGKINLVSGIFLIIIGLLLIFDKLYIIIP
ncbi:MAG: cytochrome c biogenesis protein CcdA [Clostridiales bacterium]